MLRTAGFRVRVIKKASGVKKGIVITELPSGGNAQPQSTVTIVVSSGLQLVRVPHLSAIAAAAAFSGNPNVDFVTQTEEVVRRAAARSGLKVAFSFSPSPRQSPRAGNMVPRGTTVTVWLPAG